MIWTAISPCSSLLATGRVAVAKARQWLPIDVWEAVDAYFHREELEDWAEKDPGEDQDMSTDMEAARMVRRLHVGDPAASVSLQKAIHDTLALAMAPRPEEQEYYYDSDDSVLDLDVELPDIAEDEDIFIQPLFEMVEEKEAQPSPSVRPTPKVAFLDQPEILGETRSSVDSSEKDFAKVLGLSDSVIGSDVDFDVSTKLGGTGSGVSSLSPTKSSSPDISQPRNSGVSYEDTSKSSLSLASNSQEGNCSFLHKQDPISNREPISNGDPSNLLEVFELLLQ